MLCELMYDFFPVTANVDAAVDHYKELIVFVKDRPGHDTRYTIDPANIRDELGWKPQEDIYPRIRKTVERYLENQDWWQCILSGDYKFEFLGCRNRFNQLHGI